MSALHESHDFFEIPLPPKPDPYTGNPRPPRAPVDRTSEDGSSRIKNPSKPNPPHGQSPTLEWHLESSRSAVFNGIGGFFVVALCTGLLLDPEYWYADWWLWVLPLIAGILITLTIGVGHCCAGADWFARGKPWVNTYDLTSIRVTIPQNERHLELEDSTGRKLKLQLATAQESQDLWDLVYNGILHSATNGDAEVNALAGASLRLLPPRPDLN